jgi:hypothetical protein
MEVLIQMGETVNILNAEVFYVLNILTVFVKLEMYKNCIMLLINV